MATNTAGHGPASSRSWSLPASNDSNEAVAKTTATDEATSTLVQQTLSQEAQLDPLAEIVGEKDDHVVHYKTLNWWHCGILMIAECISLGILSLPHALATLGLLP
jgi:hypothetical protein